MNSSSPGEETIFVEALRLPPEERAAYLAQAAAGNPELRQKVESLLQSYSAGDFLEKAAAPQLRSTLQVTIPITEKPGETIGRYKLLQQIGEGGCGVVYMAEQLEPVRRRVALKIIKLGMDTKSVIARFEAERQALALMDHPNIAKVLDAGATETGRPYFVMELVRGMKITEYCDEQKLCTRARLDLFLQVCHAIQHAHQKGIIHRDIKPSNILVSVDDGVPALKVIDFGIAKATSGLRLTDRTLFTAFEQFIGTPAYMSPEQAMLTNVDVDTRSDIYTLGVLLYELLTGKTPFDAQELLAIGLDEMRRTIREKEPPRPSTRLSTLPDQELSTTAQRRGLHAPKLVSELRGDLDWIVMKALEKDRARRYETANGLASDIQRHLNNEPVVACPPSNLYRLKKMVRRNKVAFAAGIAVAASLVMGLTLSTVLFFRERAARKQASEQAMIAQAVNEFLEHDLLSQASSYSQASSHFRPDPNLTVRDAVERAAKRIDDRFKNHPLQEAAVQYTIGSTLAQVGEAERAIPHLQRSLELARASLAPNHRQTLRAMQGLANAYYLAGKADAALPIFEETLKLQKSSLGPTDSDTLNTMNTLAMAYKATGKLDQALPLYKESLKLMQTKDGPEARNTLNAMNNLANAYREAGRIDLAQPLLEQTLKLMRAKWGPEDPFTQNPMFNLAKLYHGAGRLDEALPLYDEALKLRRASLGDHPDTFRFIFNVAQAYSDAGKLDQALPLWAETLRLAKAMVKPNLIDTVAAMQNLAFAYDLSGRSEEALPLRQEALDLMRAKRGPDDPDTLMSMHALAGTLARLKKYAEAETLYADALKYLRLGSSNAPPREVPTLGVTLHRLADILREQKKFSEARPLAKEAVSLYRRHTDWPVDERLHAVSVLEAVLNDLGDSQELKAVLPERVEALRAAAEQDDVDVEALNELAWILATSSDSAVRDGRSAVRFAERAVVKTERKDWTILDTLAAAWAEAGEFAKAADVQREAIALCPDENARNDFAARLRLFESNTPFRQP